MFVKNGNNVLVNLDRVDEIYTGMLDNRYRLVALFISNNKHRSKILVTANSPDEIMQYQNILEDAIAKGVPFLDFSVSSKVTDEEKEKEDVAKSFETVINYCKERKINHSSCLGCPVRIKDSRGTSQPEVCRLNMIERPSDILISDYDES